MNTEKKAKQYIIAAFIVVLIAAIWMFVSTVQAEARWGQGKGYNGDCPQTCVEPGDCWRWQEEDFFPKYKYEEEGFDNFQDWWDAVLEERASWEGKADEAIEEYGDYLTEKQENRLQELEDEILNATNMTCITNKSGLFKTITNEAQKKMDEEAAQTAAANAAAAQYTYQNQNVDNSYAYSSGGSNYSSYQNGSGLTMSGGVNYYDGRKETWYSSSVLYHYRTGEWTVDDEGFYRTSEGYYVVAASDKPQGSTFEGSKGTCIVLDSGCAGNTTDYYVNW